MHKILPKISNFNYLFFKGLLEANLDKITENIDKNLMLVTALNRHIGYDKSAEIAKKAHHEGLTLREAALSLGHVSAEEYDQLIVPIEMALN